MLVQTLRLASLRNLRAILVAALRASGEFVAGRALSWPLLLGFVAVLVGTGYLWYAQEVAVRDRVVQGGRNSS